MLHASQLVVVGVEESISQREGESVLNLIQTDTIYHTVYSLHMILDNYGDNLSHCIIVHVARHVVPPSKSNSN